MEFGIYRTAHACYKIAAPLPQENLFLVWEPGRKNFISCRYARRPQRCEPLAEFTAAWGCAQRERLCVIFAQILFFYTLYQQALELGALLLDDYLEDEYKGKNRVLSELRQGCEAAQTELLLLLAKDRAEWV